MLLNNKIALITGAAKGIGAACAAVFAEHGVKTLYLVDIDEENGWKTAENLSGQCSCIFIKADVANEREVKSVFSRITQEQGRLDILLNVAGICSTQTMFEVEEKYWDRMMEVNLKSVFFFGREALKMMIEQQYGRIASVTSISGQVGGIRTSPAYAASKAGIISLTKSFAKLGAKAGVSANTLAPGLVNTDMISDADFHYSIDEVPMGRVATPEEVADVALFLVSDLSRYVTGQCIGVNGGMFMA